MLKLVEKGLDSSGMLLCVSDRLKQNSGIKSPDEIIKFKFVKNKFPYCGSTNTAQYIFGYPILDDAIEKKIIAGKVILRGCEIDRISSLPKRRCNKCRKDFAKEPILINRKKNTFEDYRDIVTSLRFSFGGFFEGPTIMTMTRNKRGASVKTEHIMDLENPFTEKQIRAATLKRIVDTLYGKMYLHEWNKHYDDFSVLDGEQWSLDIKMTEGRIRSYRGNNAYPPYWNELKNLFMSYQ